MSHDVAIKINNLSKSYLLQQNLAHSSYKSIAETLTQSAFNIYSQAKSILKERDIDSESYRTKQKFWALDDISFEVKCGDKVAIIGRNGSGKSTLLKILSRITRPTTGEIMINGRIASLLEVGTGFHPELTGRENIFLNGAILGMLRKEVNLKFDEIVEFSGVERFLDTPVKRYSSGMYVRLAFAVAAHLDPEILLVDEVLAVGDADFQRKCIAKMSDIANQGKTVLFVSHNPMAAKQLCNYGIELCNGKIVYAGDVQATLDHYSSSMALIGHQGIRERIDRKGRQNLKFTEVKIFDTDGQERDYVKSGDDVFVRMYYDATNVFKNARVLVAFNVISPNGNVITNINNVDSCGVSLDIHRSGYFECRWPNINLRSGDFRCTIFVSVNEEIEDWIESAFVLRVEDGDFYGTGKLVDRAQGDILVNNSWRSVNV
ncbi:ABC transporter ATP-binding protein [Polynucleobacter sp. UB-Piko-W3]|uniref:ABC transporter ATP-binding protein n=1 Tax=Polynucleobacter sp. UB-Piko-W3 TaxID=1819735 RepID=UPI001C0B9216|nr:ABC transporter ATP-binding protein [Polynucleobacter sp. UB-Piko-W3]MBU3553979.1 ABC transporter ATP-binding protein [Polynucleobacter sp. UB-Piko-W3]